jgi:hypothetical protein
LADFFAGFFFAGFLFAGFFFALAERRDFPALVSVGIRADAN